MSNYSEEYPNALVKDLLWSRSYHQAMVKEIERKLLELSKRHSIDIALE